MHHPRPTPDQQAQLHHPLVMRRLGRLPQKVPQKREHKKIRQLPRLERRPRQTWTPEMQEILEARPTQTLLHKGVEEMFRPEKAPKLSPGSRRAMQIQE